MQINSPGRNLFDVAKLSFSFVLHAHRLCLFVWFLFVCLFNLIVQMSSPVLQSPCLVIFSSCFA